MSSPPTPPTPTLLLLNLPPSILCSIDLLTFTTSPTFLGIKNLPPGHHFVFTSPSPSLSLRDGFWFHIPPSPPTTPTTPCPTLYRKWSTEHEHLVECTGEEGWAAVNERGGAQVVYEKFLTPYRQSAGAGAGAGANGEAVDDGKEGAWENLTRHITSKLLDRFTGSPPSPSATAAATAASSSNPTTTTPTTTTTLVPSNNTKNSLSNHSAQQRRRGKWTITSASSALQDLDHIPGLSPTETRSVIGGAEQELGTLGIDLKKTWREGAVGRERTEQARDRSWLLAYICHGSQDDGGTGGGGDGGGGGGGGGEWEWEEVVLGQMEVCFLMVLLLANYSCLEEWKRILALVMTCEKAVGERPAFFVEFLRLLKGQLERVDDMEGGLFEMGDEFGGGMFLRGLLMGFRRVLDGVGGVGEGVEEVREEFEEVEKWVRERFGWELGNGGVLRSGMLELEDGEMVEMEMGGMEGEDESGEYAPVVVEL